MSDLKDPAPTRQVKESLDEALSQRFLAYALSTITQRALPDVRDGMKPVHRRILYAMRLLKLDAATGYKKCARIVGDVIGRFHPHGDQAIYDALARLAQDFSQRYPLIDGQGNFGNIDGDSPAAMRYTEARFTSVATSVLEGLDEDAVDFHPTYDGEDEEPDVLPGGFPHLLANGTSGIAVGMATSIPPHNAFEVCQAALHLLRHSEASVGELMRFVPGPDFPTGGVVVEAEESRAEAYKTGRGGFRLRARWCTEPLERGMWQVVVYEIPYQVPKSRLVERLAHLIETKKITYLDDIQDESTGDIRLVLQPKSRNLNPEAMMEDLFRLTELETRIPLNMNVLDGGRTPRVMNLVEVLQAFLDHRLHVLQRRTRYRLNKALARLEVLDGYLIVYLNLDEVIRILREEDDPKAHLMADFKLTETQAEAILNMRLRSLRRLEEAALHREHAKRLEEKKNYEELLREPALQRQNISEDLKALQKEFSLQTPSGARRTGFSEAPKAPQKDWSRLAVVKEPVTVVLSQKGWIRSLKGHVDDLNSLKFKEGDKAGFVVRAHTTDRLILMSSRGKAYKLEVDKLPGGRGHGEPIRVMIDMEDDARPVALFTFNPDGRRLLASSKGYGFLVEDKVMTAAKRAGKQVMNLGSGDRLAVVSPVEGMCVALVGENRKMLIFSLDELPTMTRGKGVKLQNYAEGGVQDVKVFSQETGLFFTDTAGRQVAVKDWQTWMGKRARVGHPVPRGFPRSGLFSPRTPR